jgi:hypothetical protein
MILRVDRISFVLDECCQGPACSSGTSSLDLHGDLADSVVANSTGLLLPDRVLFNPRQGPVAEGARAGQSVRLGPAAESVAAYEATTGDPSWHRNRSRDSELTS